jgi:hypothetical protein
LAQTVQSPIDHRANVDVRYNLDPTTLQHDFAIKILKAGEAIASRPLEHFNQAMYLYNIWAKLSDKYMRRRDANDLDAANSKAEKALAFISLYRSVRAMYLNEVVNRLSIRYTGTGNADDLDAAISKAEEAVASTPLNHCNRAIYLNNLGRVLSDRYTATGNADDQRMAMDSFLQSSQCSSSAPLLRIQGARLALHILTRNGNWDQAHRVSETAVNLLPRACSRFLSRDDQQHAVQQTSGLAADACSVSLWKGDVDEALRRIEFGRGLILGYASGPGVWALYVHLGA